MSTSVWIMRDESDDNINAQQQQQHNKVYAFQLSNKTHNRWQKYLNYFIKLFA